ncbi:MAG: isoaspartyl peptidase/L-asparaginase family protein [Candidatus Thiodiazotropha sp.]|nr:isoaspartyl peptidase/L-asparaginase [Candidatus Thiodiazotropha taylori]MBT3057914.1 isoaspartyl peptidase/L-asparaginase [Candidatus Thiodiazotropha sp. (ex Lucina pensylvanica)]MBV2096755.1 isoaspartyl peptidase/L-asparaginase [Candidatus Thiodiazotropha sp. (ex Codakia orbicularis)]PUB77865.1 MAG: L-asparaginase [gamma proteobacterium symbiont of Ctena orbiculata]MBT3064663.1 isoaspartyl peptidase/L-asparaginase [Candidatus Thiodiazotropha sp. (ex Lucina pensylvanica)]
MQETFSLMVHGGAGALDNVKDNKTALRYLESIRTVLEHGREILSMGGSALETVESCASQLEDDPVFNAGCGSVLNESGKVEMDAAIMDGRDLSAGAVAAVSNIANPVQLARLVMAESEHVMLISEGAMKFADHCGMKLTPDHYFFTPDRIQQLEQARLQHRIMLDHDDSDEASEEQKYGTIGAVARDLDGNLAAATSTGGIVNKRIGRVGDSPIVGAGVFADNQTCAISTTGFGEDFMRTVLAKTVSDAMEFLDYDARGAVAYGIQYLRRKVKGRGGMIVIDRQGNCAADTTTKKMIHGWIERSGQSEARF